MKFQHSIKFVLSFLLIVSIGFMEYSIIDDSASASQYSHNDIIKKDRNVHELILARNMQMDDDDDDGVIKYTEHEFYHCDLLTRLSFLIQHIQATPSSAHSLAEAIPVTDVYQLTRSYRI